MAKRKKKDTKGIQIDALLEEVGCRLIESLDELDGSYTLSTGIFPLDLIINKNGLLPGKIIEMFGSEGTGKTSIALSCASEAVKSDIPVYYFNVERAINSSVLKCFGLVPKSEKNPDGNIVLVNTSNGEAALNGIKRIMQTQKGCLVILDSVANCIPSDHFEEDIGKPSYKSAANIISPFIGQARNYAEAGEHILLLLNQQRDNLSGYGKKSREPGGRALKFNCDWRIELKRGEYIEKGKAKLGHQIKATTVKNRFMPPGLEAAFHLIYGKGFNVGLDLFYLAIEFGLIEQKGAWVFMPGDIKVQGKIEAANLITKDKDLQEKIKADIIEMMT